eukprot:SAG22_NODE_2118_length_2984_cov_2.031196_1_plen_396_part_00
MPTVLDKLRQIGKYITLNAANVSSLPLKTDDVVAAAAAAAAAPPSATVGNIRVQALSPTLLRVEPRGPLSFEDRTTFMVTGRSGWPGIPILSRNATTLTTAAWDVTVHEFPCHCPTTPKGPGNCAVNGTNFSIVVTSPSGAVLYQSPPAPDLKLATAAPEQRVSGARDGDRKPPPPPPPPGSCKSYGTGAETVCKHLSLPQRNLLHWPAPLNKTAYALSDYPRFVVPAWGATPAPPSCDPELRQTSGYDFRNNVEGDTYIFLLGDSLGSWQQSRQEFVRLAGPTPALPDWAFGTWFTDWYGYTPAEAKGNVTKWKTEELPIDVWGLDMNWRVTKDVEKCCGFTPWFGGKHCTNTSTPPVDCIHPDWYYDYPSPGWGNYSAWFAFVRSLGLRTCKC